MDRWPANSRESVSERRRPSGPDADPWCWRCVWLCTDVLRFDNTYSIFQAKRVSFTVEVLLPDHMPSPEAGGGVQRTRPSWAQRPPGTVTTCHICCCSWAQLKKLDLYLHAGQCGALNVAYTVSIKIFYLRFAPSFVAKPLNCKHALHSLWNRTTLPLYVVHGSVLPHRCS